MPRALRYVGVLTLTKHAYHKKVPCKPWSSTIGYTRVIAEFLGDLVYAPITNVQEE